MSSTTVHPEVNGRPMHARHRRRDISPLPHGSSPSSKDFRVSKECGQRGHVKTALPLLASLFLFEFSLLIIVMAMYMKGDRPFAIFLSTRPGIVFILAAPVLVAAGTAVIRRYLSSTPTELRRFRLVVTMNLVTVLLIVITCEMALRIWSGPTREGERVGSILLKPKDWEKVAEYNRDLLDKAHAVGSIVGSYYIYDDMIGWTAGVNRKARIGNVSYFSSSEGIRAPHEGITYGKLGGKQRVALMGDSFTFGDELLYEDTWGSRLDEALGPEVQVLNFGGSGYGIDQAYLRYEKEVRRWDPKVVIFSLVSHDVQRTMTVYPFINWPEWNIPFSKPRFILREGEFKELNIPPIAPDAIFSRASISELPYLEYDKGYSVTDWQQDYLHFSYLIRLFISRFPRWSASLPDVSEEALLLVNASIVKAFVRSAEQSGAIPIIVYFPTKADFEGAPFGQQASSLPVGKQVLRQAGIPYTDLTSCLLKVNVTDRFARTAHYTAQSNAAVAKCLQNVVMSNVPSFG